MSKLIIGFVLGIVISTNGVQSTFNGIARMFDKGVQTIQTHSKELAQ
jgi:hypothetical protein